MKCRVADPFSSERHARRCTKVQSCVLAAYIGYSGEGDVADKLRPKCEVQATTILGPSLWTDDDARDAAGNGICVNASPDRRLAWGN